MSADRLHTSAVALLETWDAPDPLQDSLRHTMLAFLAATPEGCLRRCRAGHVTASTLVLDTAGEHVLLTLHPRVGKWIQLGGHCEPEDESVAAAALREAREESGNQQVRLADAGLIGIHTHPITCSLGVPTRHLDLRFLAIAPTGADGALPTIARSEESVDLQWWPVDALPANTEMPHLPDLITRARQRLSDMQADPA